LIELLVVVGLMIVLMTLAIVGSGGVGAANNVSAGQGFVSSQFDLARQLASSLNRTVEVRLLKYAPLEGAAEEEQFRAIQLFRFNDDGSFSPISRPEELPTGIVMIPSGVDIDGTEASTILSELEEFEGDTVDFPINAARDGEYSYVPVRFQANSAVDLAPGTLWYVSIAGENDLDPPQNYATIQIEPKNGMVRTHRPGI